MRGLLVAATELSSCLKCTDVSYAYSNQRSRLVIHQVASSTKIIKRSYRSISQLLASRQPATLLTNALRNLRFGDRPTI